MDLLLANATHGVAGGPYACRAVDGSISAHARVWGAAGGVAMLAGYFFATAGARLFRVTAVLSSFVAAFGRRAGHLALTPPAGPG